MKTQSPPLCGAIVFYTMDSIQLKQKGFALIALLRYAAPFLKNLLFEGWFADKNHWQAPGRPYLC